VATSLDSKLRSVQALLNSILDESGGDGDVSPSHWELPILPPPDVGGRLSSTDLLNWWFRAPQGRGALAEAKGPAVSSELNEVAVRGAHPLDEESHDGWSELSLLFPAPEEHLAEEHAQGAVDCMYDFLHAVGRRDVRAASALIDDSYHTIEMGEEVDKQRFTNGLEAQIDELRNWDFEVSLAVAPEAVGHPFGVLMHVTIQFDATSRADGSKKGRVERRLAILRQESSSGSWRIAGMPKVDR
jgi:ketosteroid isomerase-like protein